MNEGNWVRGWRIGRAAYDSERWSKKKRILFGFTLNPCFSYVELITDKHSMHSYTAPEESEGSLSQSGIENFNLLF